MQVIYLLSKQQNQRCKQHDIHNNHNLISKEQHNHLLQTTTTQSNSLLNIIKELIEIKAQTHLTVNVTGVGSFVIQTNQVSLDLRVAYIQYRIAIQ